MNCFCKMIDQQMHYYEKQGGLKQVIYRLPDMLRTFICLFIYHQAVLGTSVDRHFWIPKITADNLCVLFHDIISPFLPTLN